MDWQKQGYFVVPRFLDDEPCARLRRACDHVLEQVLTAPNGARQADSSNIAFLTSRKYFRSDEEIGLLVEMLELVASARVHALLAPLGAGPLRFFNTQYFYEQRSRSWDGAWHRDTQFETPDPEAEKARMREIDSVHFRIALEPDDRLEVVPGSHRRWDTPEELAIRRGSDPAKTSRADMPGRVRVALERGDACVFHAWMIHRGTYRTSPPRRTFDVIYAYGPPPSFGEPAPSDTFHDPEVLRRLTPAARAFFLASLAWSQRPLTGSEWSRRRSTGRRLRRSA
jgi:ectoine hydroxylase-related dioxygenase (phytanoyl-CoA dioxygenase family)